MRRIVRGWTWPGWSYVLSLERKTTKVQPNLATKLFAWLQQAQSFSKEESQHRTKELVLINCIQNAFFVSMKSVVVKQAHRSTCNAIITIAMFIADF
jgi:hypothetical protein